MRHAQCLFDQLYEPDVVCYNALFKGYTQNKQHNQVLSLFRRMMKSHVKPTCYSFPLILKACAKLSALCEGQQVHSFAIKAGFGTNPFVGNTLIEMYSGAEKVGLAYQVFGEMPARNIVTWTSMINGLIFCRNIKFAREIFDLVEDKDVILWNTMMSGYIGIGDMGAAHKLFDIMPHKDTLSWNTMLNGYANYGKIEDCEKFFEVIPKRNVFSWNGLIGAYANQGSYFEVLTAFKRMLSEAEVLPNDVTLVFVLTACARLGALDQGMWLHLYAHRVGYSGYIFVENALMDMYAKCGRIEYAVEVFKGLSKRDLVSWNTIIGGLAMHGHASDALAFFDQMKNAGVQPDGVTFVGVLCACTHIGLVNEGLTYFQSMANYSISPEIEHYGCLVDLYARSGLLAEALQFVEMMPMKADAAIWGSLLGASRIYKNVEIAELALEQLIELEPGNPTNYLLSSTIYGDAGNWKTMSDLKIAMRDTRFRKAPGCSMIDIHDQLVEFHSSDQRLPETEEIYICLTGLSKLSQSLGFQPENLEAEEEV